MGLVVCGRCGQRLMVQYGGRASRLRYTCGRAAVEYAAPVCQGLAGRVVDDLVAEQVLAALQPAALEVGLRASEELDQERRRLDQLWQQRARQFTAGMLRRLLGERGSGPSTGQGLQAGEWWPSGLAGRLRMPLETVQRWMRVGWVHTRRLADSRRRWVVWADEDELERLRQLRECDQSWANRERRAELARPKPRPNP
jgi:hypothetical protein